MAREEKRKYGKVERRGDSQCTPVDELQALAVVVYRTYANWSGFPADFVG